MDIDIIRQHGVSLHFVGGCKGFQEILSIFPWTKEWEHIIENYNEMIVITHAQNAHQLRNQHTDVNTYATSTQRK